MVPQRDAPGGWLTRYNALVAVLLVQAVAALVWAVRTDSSVAELQRQNADQDARIGAIDTKGTRRLTVVDDRQQRVIMEIMAIEGRLGRLEMIHR